MHGVFVTKEQDLERGLVQAHAVGLSPVIQTVLIPLWKSQADELFLFCMSPLRSVPLSRSVIILIWMRHNTDP